MPDPPLQALLQAEERADPRRRAGQRRQQRLGDRHRRGQRRLRARGAPEKGQGNEIHPKGRLAMRAAFWALLLLVAAAAAAQEFDVYDPNDFIDPRVRGALFEKGCCRVVENGTDFTLMRVYAGNIYDYQWRSTSTGADLKFLHLATAYYRGDKQFNLKLTGFDPHGAASVPNSRGTMQFGKYFVSGAAREGEEDRRIAGRILLTWSVERGRFEDSPSERSQLHHEFGAEGDVRIPLPFSRLDNVDGSVIWMRRRVAEGQYVDRLSYLYRFRERQRSNGRLQLNASLGFGGERADGWHCCLARGVFTATYIVPRINIGVNAAFAPTFAPAAQGRRTHRELALYLDHTLVAHVADMLKR